MSAGMQLAMLRAIRARLADLVARVDALLAALGCGRDARERLEREEDMDRYA